MKEEQPYMNRFIDLGVKPIFTNKDGVIVVDIPSEKIQPFVQLYLELMKPARWNEYVGPLTGFYFKLPDGNQKHIILTKDNENEIKENLKIFIPSWDTSVSLWDWLASIDIYQRFLSN